MNCRSRFTDWLLTQLFRSRLDFLKPALIFLALCSSVFHPTISVAQTPPATRSQEPALIKEWKSVESEIDQLVESLKSDQAFKLASTFIEKHPEFAPAWAARAWIQLDEVDSLERFDFGDNPPRNRYDNDPVEYIYIKDPVRISEGRRLIIYTLREIQFTVPKQFERAQKDISMANRIAPTEYSIDSASAFMAEFVGEHDRALEFIEKLKANNRFSARDAITHATVLEQKGEFAAALEIAQELLTHPIVGSRASRLAILLSSDIGRRELGRRIADEWVKESPNCARARALRSALRSPEEVDLRIADLTSAISIEPDVAFHWTQRALNYWKLKHDDDAALRDLDEALRLKPKSFVPYYFRANILIDRHDFAGARRDLDTAAELSPYINWTFRRRAVALDGLNEPEAAAADRQRDAWLERLFDLAYEAGKAKSNPKLWADVARYCRLGNDWVWKEIAIKKALDSHPGSADALRERAAFRIHKNDLDGALEDANQAVEMATTSRNLEMRGNVYAARSDWDNAIADYEEGKVVTTSAITALETRAKIHQKAVRLSQAKADRDAAARLQKLLDQE